MSAEDKEKPKDLEDELDVKKIEPILEDAMQRYLGVTINELKDDITDRLHAPWTRFEVDTKIPFKEAKHEFKKRYLQRLLRLHFGNVSEVARLAGINRRSIHRIIADLGIDVETIRKEMVRQYDIKQQAVNHIIEDVLTEYKEVLHPQKLEELYANVGEVSRDLVDELPANPETLDKAEREFEKQYIEIALSENAYNITHTANAIGLRYETLHRKMKELGIENKK